MVVKMMRWPPWPPASRKFQVKLLVLRLHGLSLQPEETTSGLMAEVRWKGPKSAFTTLRKQVRRNCTKEALLLPVQVQEQKQQEIQEIVEEIVQEQQGNKGTVEWNEEFQHVCTLTSNAKDNAVFHPWEISFHVFNGSKQGPKNKTSVIGSALLNLAEFASAAGNKETLLNIPLSVGANTTETPLSLHLALSLLELRTAQELPEIVQRMTTPVPSPPNQRDNVPVEKDESSGFKGGLRKVPMFRGFMSKSKKTRQEDYGIDEKFSLRSDDPEYTCPCDSDSMDEDLEKDESKERKENSNIRKSFNYGTLATANHVGESLCSEMSMNGDFEGMFFYRNSDVGCSQAEEATTSFTDMSMLQTSKRSILSSVSWKKRKMGFRSPKHKGEPLLKPYGEVGGDDIDFDRRQISPDEFLGWHKIEEDIVPNRLSTDFGDDHFVVGSWEAKEIVSRDGHMKLCTQVFFASIDQRSERAAGESACTALVAVIANWFKNNLEVMPIKSQFDSLIREGSMEWRNLCENETYRQRFPDKHFDLETVLEAKIRPLTVDPSKSFIGFFHPEGVSDDNNGFEFLDEAMSFDSIWEEISRSAIEHRPFVDGPQLYIVSWNDHFFILKVESDAYYIMDTLGERLFEGCNQAYILKFDENTSIQRTPVESKSSNAEETESGIQQAKQNVVVCEKEESSGDISNGKDDDVDEKKVCVVCKGKESCKEYIKNFLAAIPIRELQVDMKKGLSSTPIHHRLQIEFHYTELSKES